MKQWQHEYAGQLKTSISMAAVAAAAAIDGEAGAGMTGAIAAVVGMRAAAEVGGGMRIPGVPAAAGVPAAGAAGTSGVSKTAAAAEASNGQ